MAGSVPNNYMLVRNAVDRGVQLCDIEPVNNVTQALTEIILRDEAKETVAAKPKGLAGLGNLGLSLFRRKAG